jgi:hypothetical protein
MTRQETLQDKREQDKTRENKTRQETEQVKSISFFFGLFVFLESQVDSWKDGKKSKKKMRQAKYHSKHEEAQRTIWKGKGGLEDKTKQDTKATILSLCLCLCLRVYLCVFLCLCFCVCICLCFWSLGLPMS